MKHEPHIHTRCTKYLMKVSGSLFKAINNSYGMPAQSKPSIGLFITRFFVPRGAARRASAAFSLSYLEMRLSSGREQFAFYPSGELRLEYLFI
jgi:hypothetical protein